MPATGLRVYQPRRSKQVRFGVLMILFGLLGLLPMRELSQYWFSGGPLPDGRAFLALLCLLFIPLGLLGLVNALRGLPRLTTTADGLNFHSVFGARWAKWNSLGPFTVKTIHSSRFSEAVLAASADIIGADASRGPLRARTFSVSDSFLTPLEAIVDELNAERAQALGACAALALPQVRPEADQNFGLVEFRAPWLTFTLLVLLVSIFVAEQLFAVTPGSGGTPSIATLAAMGGLSRNAVLISGEWYRLFTAPLLHASVVHLFGNGLALFLGGRLFERLVGRVWFLVILVLGALGGSLMSITINPAAMISVGASGALMAMFAATMVASFRLPAGTPARHALQRLSLQVLIPSLLPIFSTNATGHVDYGAHLGGALTGLAISFLLLGTWRSGEPLPPFRTVAAGIAGIGVLVFAASAALAAAGYAQYNVTLIPATEWPKINADAQGQAAGLVARYPGDPRSHLYLGGALAASGDNAGAERELRIALAGAQHLAILFGPQLEFGARGALASQLANEGRQDEARAIARPACAAAAEDANFAKFVQVLIDQQLCD